MTTLPVVDWLLAMLLVSLVFLVMALVLVGVGIAVGLVVCALGGLLLGLGVVSSSVLVGLRSRRPALALRVFLLQCGVLAGAPLGGMGAWLLKSFLASVDQAAWVVMIGGAAGGAAGGSCVALLLDSCLRRLHRWAVPPDPTLP